MHCRSKLLLFASFTLPLVAQPALFYSDLDSGPNSGGEQNGGAYVTLYGRGFGTVQGSSIVTVGGFPAATYPVWTDGKIAFQLGPLAATGGILVITPSGISSPLPFTVRPGVINFVSAAGSDSNSGSFASPWATLLHALAAMNPGDIAYAMNGVAQTSDDGSGWSTCMLLDGIAGTPGKPKALVTYPGAIANIGSTTACGTAVRSKGSGNDYLTFAGFTVLGVGITFNPYNNHDWRLVANDLSCPNGNDQAGCLDIGGDNSGGGSHDMKILGNHIHHVGTNLPPQSVTALYHGVYLSEINHDVDFGWNSVAFVNGGRCVQQNVNEGGGSYSLSIHDNVIHDCQLDGIVMTTVNPSRGSVALYNNVIYNVGKGPANAENSGAWNCMNIQGWMAWGASGESGIVQVYNNTMYACGTWSSPPYGQSSGGVLWEDGNNTAKGINLTDNVVFLTTGSTLGLPYVTNSDRTAAITGSNNLFFGNGSTLAGLNNLTNTMFADPLFVSAATGDFHLSSLSPAAQGGVITASIEDFDGLSLPQGLNYPIGAYGSPAKSGSPAVVLSINPSVVSLQGGQTQSFAAIVANAGNQSVTWKMSALLGTLTNAGFYTAPAIVSAQQVILVSATSVADNTKIATAKVTLIPITVTASPLAVDLRPGQTQWFAATNSGTDNPGVTWSLSSPTGTLSPAGLYTAPNLIAIKTTVKVTATSVVDPAKFSAASITLLPPQPLAVTVSPASASLAASRTQQFLANTGVVWSMNRTAGTLSPVGLYTAPNNITTQQTVLVTARSIADPTKSASSTVTLNPAAKQDVTVTVTQSAKGLQVSWTAPPGRPSTDWVGLSSLHAPNWWSVWSEYTNGATSGAFTIPTPAGPGVYELRYFGRGGYTILARSSPLSLGVLGFSTSADTASTVISRGGPLPVSWTAGQGRTSSDYVGLFAVGATSDNPIWWEPAQGLPAGTSPGWGAPTTPGAYEFRYITGDGYMCVATSSQFAIH